MSFPIARPLRRFVACAERRAAQPARGPGAADRPHRVSPLRRYRPVSGLPGGAKTATRYRGAAAHADPAIPVGGFEPGPASRHRHRIRICAKTRRGTARAAAGDPPARRNGSNGWPRCGSRFLAGQQAQAGPVSFKLCIDYSTTSHFRQYTKR